MQGETARYSWIVELYADRTDSGNSAVAAVAMGPVRVVALKIVAPGAVADQITGRMEAPLAVSSTSWEEVVVALRRARRSPIVLRRIGVADGLEVDGCLGRRFGA